MKHALLFSSVLCLILGLLCGMLLPTPWDPQIQPAASLAEAIPAVDQDAASVQHSDSSVSEQVLNPKDNVSLLNAAYRVATALNEQSYGDLADLVHTEKGVRFTPYSTVNPDTDVTLTAEQIKGLADDATLYTWGTEDGRGDLIELTIAQYLERFVYNEDYILAPQIGVDKVILAGNALENITEAYPGCRFVDFCFPSVDPVNQGLDWCSLKLVFEPGLTQWQLVGIVHGQWTV